MNHQPLSASGPRMCSTSARRTVKNFLKSATSMAILANTASGSANSSPTKAFFSNTRRTSPQLAALPQEARSRCCPDRPPAEEFSTLAHEVAHELMHRDERRASTSKRSRETEAEAVAFVVCQGIGLETGSAAQDYIQLYEGDAKLLSESLRVHPANRYSYSQRYRRGGNLRAARLGRARESINAGDRCVLNALGT